VHEDREPDVVGDLFDTGGLTGEDVAEVDFLPIEADASALCDRNCLVVEGSRREGPCKGAVSASPMLKKVFSAPRW
jgi:hypothetical protein